MQGDDGDGRVLTCKGGRVYGVQRRRARGGPEERGEKGGNGWGLGMRVGVSLSGVPGEC